MNSALTLKIKHAKEIRVVLTILFLMVCLKYLALEYNLSVLPETPQGGYSGRASLAAGITYFTHDPSHPVYADYDITPEDSRFFIHHAEPGLAAIHSVIKFITGTSSYKRLVILQIILDSICAYLLFLTCKNLGLSQKIRYAALIMYVAFVPNYYFILAPAYNAWLFFYLVIFQFLIVSAAVRSGSFKNLALLMGAVLVLTVVAALIRSPAIMYPLFMGLLFTGVVLTQKLFGSVLKQKNDVNQPLLSMKLSMALLLTGCLAVGAMSTINYMLRGEFSPTRSTAGHQFWVGVGRHQNPYGLTESDAAVAEFYEKQTGETDTGNTMGVEYNQFLSEKALEFIREYPVLYLHYLNERVDMVLSPLFVMWINSAKDAPDSLYVYTLILRYIFNFVLVCALLLSIHSILNRPILILFVAPLLYSAFVISLVYITNVIVHVAWSAALPIVPIGLSVFGKYLAYRRHNTEETKLQ